MDTVIPVGADWNEDFQEWLKRLCRVSGCKAKWYRV